MIIIGQLLWWRTSNFLCLFLLINITATKCVPLVWRVQKYVTFGFFTNKLGAISGQTNDYKFIKILLKFGFLEFCILYIKLTAFLFTVFQFLIYSSSPFRRNEMEWNVTKYFLTRYSSILLCDDEYVAMMLKETTNK